MNTIVVQSFRANDVPSWIVECMATVRKWAQDNGFCYRFMGDGFLQLAPDWYREKAAGYLTVVTDLARLELAKQCLLEGFERCIWIDADVVIFLPSLLNIDPHLPFGFCREVWLGRDGLGRLICDERVNNSVCVFRQDSIEWLENYIANCNSIVKQLPILRDNLEVGTRYLTNLHRLQRLPLIDHVGLISRLLMEAILRQDTGTLRLFMERTGGPLYAANLCNYFRTRASDPRVIDDKYRAVFRTLVDRGDEILNSIWYAGDALRGARNPS